MKGGLRQRQGEGRLHGYRDPGPDEEDEAFYLGARFEDQFEDDRYGLVFRKFGRGPPVRVTYKERDELSERFERFQWRGGVALAIAVCAYFIVEEATDFWREAGAVSPLMPVAAMVAIASAAWFARRSYWLHLVSPLDRRTPVGAERTFRDQLLSRALAVSWSKVLLTIAGGAFAAWVIAGNISSDDPADLAEGLFALPTLATVGVLVAAKILVTGARGRR